MNHASFRVERIVERTKRFEKQVKSLDKRTQLQFELVIQELLTGTISQSRHLEKKEGTDNIYTVRLDRKNRFAFALNPDNTIKPIAVGNHDKVYKNR